MMMVNSHSHSGRAKVGASEATGEGGKVLSPGPPGASDTFDEENHCVSGPEAAANPVIYHSLSRWGTVLYTL